MTTAAKIRKYLDEKHLSQNEFARVCGLPQSRISDLLKGEQISIRLAVPIAEAMGVSIDWLVLAKHSWPPTSAATPPRDDLDDDERRTVEWLRGFGDPDLRWTTYVRRRLRGQDPYVGTPPVGGPGLVPDLPPATPAAPAGDPPGNHNSEGPRRRRAGGA